MKSKSLTLLIRTAIVMASVACGAVARGTLRTIDSLSDDYGSGQLPALKDVA